MPSQYNIEYLKKTKEKLKTGKAFYFTDFTGISVQNMEKLRRELKKNNGNYLVLKNTLGLLAMKDLGYEEEVISKMFTGPTGIAIAFDDPIPLAKIITNYENLKIKGSLIEGKFYVTEDVIRFSRIPPKESLYGQLVGSLNLLGNFANVLESLLRNLISTIEAIKNKEEK
ncbi:MAG TPA: 50S ribosomal protein L10 [candidate division WOR-3 bacterium]|uniref:Large ribosomal subunit protein uL10 n=1 Tax=candidate division WOR-3 bacterium TaxID=2052148 RepID=A0A9C9EM89_UNCW3|nr:50S ribosomal protein L10 [candidate division WOR-3 bacterium]